METNTRSGSLNGTECCIWTSSLELDDIGLNPSQILKQLVKFKLAVYNRFKNGILVTYGTSVLWYTL